MFRTFKGLSFLHRFAEELDLVTANQRPNFSRIVKIHRAVAGPLVSVPEELPSEVPPRSEGASNLRPEARKLLRSAEWEGVTRVDEIRAREVKIFHRSDYRGQETALARRDSPSEKIGGLLLRVNRHNAPSSSQKLERICSGAEPQLDGCADSPCLALPLDVVQRTQQELPGRTVRGPPIIGSPPRRTGACVFPRQLYTPIVTLHAPSS
jgi:hypothetical protein